MKPRLVAPCSASGTGYDWPDDAETGANDALDDQREAEGQQQAVQRIELVEVAQQRRSIDDAEQRRPTSGASDQRHTSS